MDLRGLSGSAMTAYMTGMQAIGQSKDISKQVALATKTGSVSYSSFATVLKQSGARNTAGVEMKGQTECYYDHLKEKYGIVRIESVGRDQRSLDKIAGTMSGSDVVIAPNMLEKMAREPETAKYYEDKIDDYFNNFVPQETAWCAARGLVFESCGVVIHEDGTMTEICGCRDSDERVAEVEREHREKLEKEAAKRKEYIERAQEEADTRRRNILESLEKREALSQMLESYNNSSVTFSGDMFFVSEPAGMTVVSNTVFSGMRGTF